MHSSNRQAAGSQSTHSPLPPLAAAAASTALAHGGARREEFRRLARGCGQLARWEALRSDERGGEGQATPQSHAEECGADGTGVVHRDVAESGAHAACVDELHHVHGVRREGRQRAAEAHSQQSLLARRQRRRRRDDAQHAGTRNVDARNVPRPELWVSGRWVVFENQQIRQLRCGSRGGRRTPLFDSL